MSHREDNSGNQFQVNYYFSVGFQLIQEKIVKMMSTIQAILLMCYRMSKLVDEDKISIGQIAMTKAWVT
jgi:acyl-CoA oxidase